jgi:hypothetical protein
MAQSNTQPVVLLVDASELKLNQWQSAVEAYPGFGTLGVTFVHAPYSDEVESTLSDSKGAKNIALVVLGDKDLPSSPPDQQISHSVLDWNHYPTTVSVAEYLCSYLVKYSGTIIAASQNPEYCEKIVQAAGNVQTMNSWGDRAAIPNLIFEALTNIHRQSK